MNQPRRIRLTDEAGEHLTLDLGGASPTSSPTTGAGGLVLIDPARPGAPLTAEVVVEGWRFVFTIEDEARAVLRQRAGQGGGATLHHGELAVRSAIPGRVVAVDVIEGGVVEAGDRLVVVEAMKMQNEIRAPRDGTIVRVAVVVGATIEVGGVLAVLG
jgi:biotin carboxyl carrier protein